MHFRSFRRWSMAVLIVSATIVAAGAAQDTASPGDPLIAGFKSTYAASVSDAVELVAGKNSTMRHDMKLMTGTNLVGGAVTSLARPAPTAQATPALSVKHSVEIIDEATPGDVGVIVMEGTLDIATMGNLMATAAVERGMAGMVLDGAIRDLWTSAWPGALAADDGHSTAHAAHHDPPPPRHETASSFT